jgi:hypothetical protein
MLTWSEIKLNASNFAHSWKNEKYEKGQAQTFYNEFFEIFGIKRRLVARFEEHVRKIDNTSGFIDLYWPRVLIVEHKSASKNLNEAENQVGEYFDSLPFEELPRYQLVCNFQEFRLLDRDTGENVCFELSELPNYIENFSFVIGKQKPLYVVKSPVNVKASQLVADLYKSLCNSGYKGHCLEQFLVRIVFCLFADDTGIFQPRDIFHDYIESRTKKDGSDLGPALISLFQALNEDSSSRPSTLDSDLCQFPYINGLLFSELLPIPRFNSEMRATLLTACNFDWSQISPAVFGSLFQSVFSQVERRSLGGYYTSESNILKVLDSLFLNKLREEFKDIKSSSFQKIDYLKRLQIKLKKLNFFDPACGCGNFLVVAYREIRRLELDILVELNRIDSKFNLNDFSLVDVDQFHGIEIKESSVKIAECALWMIDHILNTHLSIELNVLYYRLPLRSKPNIIVGDALILNWNSVIASDKCSYIIGNPPYKGSKFLSSEEKEALKKLSGMSSPNKTLDYVAGWFFKAARYMDTHTQLCFVATSSIVQGEQASLFWTPIFDIFNLEINFAHQSFSWDSELPGRSHVYVVIIALSLKQLAYTNKILFLYKNPFNTPEQIFCKSISPYLFKADSLSNPSVMVRREKKPINGLKHCQIGTKPIDGGYYILTEEERRSLLEVEPGAKPYICPFVGADEFLYNIKRYIVCADSIPPNVLRYLPHVQGLIRKVEKYRLGEIPSKGRDKIKQKGISSTQLAKTPKKFHVTVIPKSQFLVIPEVTSEHREYIPIGWLNPPVIPSNLVKIVINATLSDFGLLTSAMHMAWMRVVGGRLEGRYRYSIGLVYNTFPQPHELDVDKLSLLSAEILDIRTSYKTSSLSDLYDKSSMPTRLRTSHEKLDKFVDGLYRKKSFFGDLDRVEYLMSLYEKSVVL